MGEIIEALIKKYEAKVAKATELQSEELKKAATEQDEVFLQSMQMDVLNSNEFIADLKKLPANQ